MAITINRSIINNTSINENNALNSLLDNVNQEFENEDDIINHIKYCTGVDFQEMLQEANCDICMVNLTCINLINLRYSGGRRHTSQISCITSQGTCFDEHTDLALDNSRCHQQCGPQKTNQSVKHHTTTNIFTRYHNGVLIHGKTGHHGQLNTHSHQTTYPSSPKLIYDITTDYDRTDGLSPTTRKLTTQFTEDTESALAQTTIHTANRIFANIILMAD